MSEEQKGGEQKTVAPKAEPKPVDKEQFDRLAGRVKTLEDKIKDIEHKLIH